MSGRLIGTGDSCASMTRDYRRSGPHGLGLDWLGLVAAGPMLAGPAEPPDLPESPAPTPVAQPDRHSRAATHPKAGRSRRRCWLVMVVGCVPVTAGSPKSSRRRYR